MKSDLVTISRLEYESLLKRGGIKEVEMTPSVKRALNRARKNLAEGKFLTLDEFSKQLGIARRNSKTY
jgi:hypothetical protein